MFPDPLTLKYLLLAVFAIWGSLAVIATRRSFASFLLGSGVFLIIAYIALGSGFSIRLPYLHEKMELIVYTVHQERVHALAHPLNRPGEPIHIVFSIDPDTRAGARMRKSFFDAVRAREGKRHQTKIVIDMRGHFTDLGVYKYEVPPAMPPKMPQ
ncbi:MAG: hypothetical protein JMN27_01910 [gamma proteobacterium endosymbiont of Lamellibrachia anaximandri]|nr:hypothetical protein [gamma proteobacterium endosymbiont of Lamellibrachia anaximandri]MBL3532574.1 hypothetical protein [gamma proteobacterium endosymbiont of Lamellibrachia anaximandri]MBL3600556.1 hypothetical protein [gamma proteobacterium endosymbiont of Lamellibrachia anaximandri]